MDNNQQKNQGPPATANRCLAFPEKMHVPTENDAAMPDPQQAFDGFTQARACVRAHECTICMCYASVCGCLDACVLMYAYGASVCTACVPCALFISPRATQLTTITMPHHSPPLIWLVFFPYRCFSK